MNSILIPIGGFVLGGAIGYGFGAIQRSALRRHEKLQRSKGLRSGWNLIPGSMRRTAMLLATLAVIQIGCPMLFEGNTVQWVVSAGIVIGYGWTLLKRLMDHNLSGA